MENIDVNAVNAVIDNIANRLSVPAEALVNAYVVRGGAMITSIIAETMLMIFLWFVSITALRRFRHRFDEFSGTVAAVLTAIFAVITLIWAFILIDRLELYMFWWTSPQAYGVLRIMEVLRTFR